MPKDPSSFNKCCLGFRRVRLCQISAWSDLNTKPGSIMYYVAINKKGFLALLIWEAWWINLAVMCINYICNIIYIYIPTYLHYITLHYITLHYITLHYTTLHYTTLHYITLHYITLHTYIHIYIYYIIFVYICYANMFSACRPFDKLTFVYSAKSNKLHSRYWCLSRHL